jgi:hypothetical protein
MYGLLSFSILPPSPKGGLTGHQNGGNIFTAMSKITLETPDIYSLADAAKEIGVHFNTIYRWVRWSLDSEGDRAKPPVEIRPFRIGDQLYLSAEDVKTLKSNVQNNHVGDKPG